MYYLFAALERIGCPAISLIGQLQKKEEKKLVTHFGCHSVHIVKSLEGKFA
jgi:hypothetical protein